MLPREARTRAIAACVLSLSVALAACGGAGTRATTAPLSDQPPEAAVVAATRPMIETAHPLAREFPLTIGATWAYVIERDDECAGKGSARVVQGAITETVVAAWQAGSAEVYQLDVRTEMHGLSQRRQDHYIILNDALYRVQASPERLVEAGGEGFEAMQVLPWPIAVGRSFGPARGGTGAWQVVSEGAPPGADGIDLPCYLLRRSAQDSRREAWYCPGRGMASLHVQVFGNPTTDEVWRLAAFDRRASASTPDGASWVSRTSERASRPAASRIV